MKKRLIAILMALTMVLAYMPAMAFAEEADSGKASTPVSAEPLKDGAGDFDHVKIEAENYVEDYYAEVEVDLVDDREIIYDADEYSLNFPEYGDVVIAYVNEETIRYTYDGYVFVNADGDELDYTYWVNGDVLSLEFEAYMTDEEYSDSELHLQLYGYADLPCTVITNVSSISFSPSNITLYSEDVKTESGKYDFWNRGAKDGMHPFIAGDSVTVKNNDGSVIIYYYKESYFDEFIFANGADEIYVYPYDDWLVPGNNTFNISAKGKEAPVTVFLDTPELRAQRAAAAAAAAEAARQGTPDGSIAKVKASKPKAAKGAVTVKWKKLNKKQLKKGKSTHYEVWVCPNKAFGAADTKMKVVGKGKSSAKIGGLAKKTTYYAKVRAIKYVGGVKMVGNWSAVKKIKTK